MITLSVEKVKCGGCAANVKQAVLAKDPQAQVQVDVANKQVEIDSRLDGHTLATIVSQAGYPASLIQKIKRLRSTPGPSSCT